MKIIAMFFASVMTGLVYAASINDTCISFSTKGPDTYLDGSVVLDGECYALVWSKDGVFDGFNAKGECIDALDRIVLQSFSKFQKMLQMNCLLGIMRFICSIHASLRTGKKLQAGLRTGRLSSSTDSVRSRRPLSLTMRLSKM